MYTLAVAVDGTMTLAQDGTSAISAVTVKQNVSAPYTYIYNAEGQLVCKMKSSEFQMNNIPGTGLFILKCGNKTTKIVK